MQYKNNKTQKMCTDEREMRKQRSDVVKKLRRRVKALEAADTLGSLQECDPQGRWHPLHGRESHLWAGDLSGNWRILVEPSPKGTLAAVEVTVTEIRDYH